MNFFHFESLSWRDLIDEVVNITFLYFKRSYTLVPSWSIIFRLGIFLADLIILDLEFLSEIITARYEEIFLKINDILEQVWRAWKLAWGVHLIGWGAKIKNIDLLAREIFKLPSFLGRDRVLKLWDLSNNVQFVNVIWDYLWYDKYGEEGWWWFVFNLSFDWFKNIINFFRKLF